MKLERALNVMAHGTDEMIDNGFHSRLCVAHKLLVPQGTRGLLAHIYKQNFPAPSAQLIACTNWPKGLLGATPHPANYS